MSTQNPSTTHSAPTASSSSPSGSEHRGESRAPARRQAAVLVTEHGRTAIADTVVEKIVAMAVQEIPGVYALGGTMSRAFGSIRERIPGSSRAVGQGVSVEVGERQAAADIDLVADYGVPVHELAASVRENVINAIETMTGLEVTEVNINIDDVHLPHEDDRRGESRVE